MPSSKELRAGDCFEKVVEALPLALLLADQARRIVFSNREADELFGRRSTGLLGQNIDVVLDGLRTSIGAAFNPLQSSTGPLTLVSCSRIAAEPAGEVERQMSAIIESAEDGIVTKSLDGIVRSWNAGAERLLGYRAEEVVGGPVTRFIPEDLREEENMILNRLRKGQRVEHFETVRLRRDGSAVDVSLTISPIRDRSGVIVGASKIMRDISDRKRIEADLRSSNAALVRINEELDEFVYTASHDLRSPLSSIGALAQWILDDDHALSEQTRDRLRLIDGRIERMKRLLDDIRRYASSGRSDELSGEQLTAAALATQVIDSLLVAPGFSIRCDPGLEAVKVTSIPLAQVFGNLIGNALKHHDRQTGTVAIGVDASGPMLKFYVTDDGPGIPREYREEIFGMFKTLKPKDEIEGSGMGLALVRKIVGRMGGDCGVRPAAGRGAEFWFDWPKPARESGNLT